MSLEALLSPDVLRDETGRDHAAARAAHPARMVTVDGFLRDEIARAISRFMLEHATFEREHMGYPDRHLGESEWLAAPSAERLLSRNVVKGVRPGAEFEPDTLTFLRFRGATATEAMAERLARLTGLSLARTTPLRGHAMHPGDFVALHDDRNNEDKQLAVILYLSPAWERAHGGELCIVDGAGSTHVVEPRFNRLVAFEIADTKHWVERVRPGAPPRLSISGWY